MYYYFMYNRLAFMEHYHMRSNIESAFSMINAMHTLNIEPAFFGKLEAVGAPSKG